MMRLMVDSLMALMLAGLLAGIMAQQRHDEQVARDEQMLRANVRLIQQEIVVQAALERVPRNSAGYPNTISPEWFGSSMPVNPLFAGQPNPWLEIASTAEAGNTNPEVKACDQDGKLATFWYNPANGIIRARVPYLANDARTLDVYNFVNGCNLASLFSAHLDNDPIANNSDGAVPDGGRTHRALASRHPAATDGARLAMARSTAATGH